MDASFVGAFGKVPRLGDFVRVRAGAEPAASFQAILVRAVEWSSSRSVPSSRPPEAGDPPTVAFIVQPKPAGPVLLGAVRGSRDAVGRRFPMSVFGSVAETEVGERAHHVPLCFAGFFADARRALDAALAVESTADLERMLDSLAPPRGLATGADDYLAWSRGASARAVWGAAYGSSDAAGAAYAVHTIVEALLPFRGDDTPATSTAVRLPVGAGGGLEVSAWLDLVRHAGGWRRRVPTTLWTVAPDGQPRDVLVALGEMHPSTLATAWEPRAESEHVCDLASPSPSLDVLRSYQPLSAELTGALDREGATLAEVVSALSSR
jgi:type VI secretion system ImpM family protein